ncbi:MAG: response regulator, partial [Deltaproteobacteria bacterium]|nr:response regulator [Deltaproteobacteria bacterium]
MKLLIVDEDQHFCGIIGTVLENDGHEVVALAHSRGALGLVGTVLPDVLLVSAEVAGPGGGVQLLRDLRRQPGGESVTTILMTNYADEAMRRACTESRTEHVLVRPFSVLDLASLVRSLDLPRPAEIEASPARGTIDLHNLSQCVRLWASAASGTLSVERDGRTERVLVTGGGLVDAGALATVRDALFGADIEFHAHDPVGVADRKAFGAMLLREAEAHEGNSRGDVTRAAVLSRTRFTDAVRDLPVSPELRRLVEQLDGPIVIGTLCDRAGVDFAAAATRLGALGAMGLLAVQPVGASWSASAPP